MFCPVENQSMIWQICKNVNIKVSRERKHTSLIKEVGSQHSTLFSANVLRGRASWRCKRSAWPQSLERLADDGTSCHWLVFHLLMNYELLLLTQTLHATQPKFLLFFNLGKAACLIEMGYCRILIISSDLISKTLKIQRWMLKMRNLIHSKIQRLLKACVSLLVHVFKKRNGKEMNLQTPFMAQSTINAHFT